MAKKQRGTPRGQNRAGAPNPSRTPAGTPNPGSKPAGTANPESTPANTPNPGSKPAGTANPESTPPATPYPSFTPNPSPASSGAPGGVPNRPGASSSRRPAGQRPARQRQSGQHSSASRRPAAPPPIWRRLSPIAMISIAALAVGVVVVAIAVLSQPKAVTPDSALVTPGILTPSDIPSSGRTLGAATAPATVDLYGDFRCSACYYFTVTGPETALVDSEVATGRARIVWHDFLTIDRFDKGTASRDAANAAWCAADQGKFWTMHGWLYANQSPTEAASAFTKTRLKAMGQAAGMDMGTFGPCVDNGTHDAEVKADDAGVPAGLGGTPGIVVNGTILGTGGSVPGIAEIQAAIDAVAGSPAPSTAPSTVASPSG